ncbi:MAG: threonylcarbamoyl-AMP synthase [Bacteroidetes bacterium]|nr:threonylcarbamoyl-AMP synthase [Bacteroidota bacterium]
MENDIINSLKVLLNGGVILYPTDTIWGLGCDATNIAAIERVYKIKRRQDKHSMLILLSDIKELSKYVTQIPRKAIKLIESSVHPVTIIYPSAQNLPQNILAEDQSIGIRITEDPFCSELISRFGKPLVSTSANLSGSRNPGNFSEIEDEVIMEADWVVRWRQNDNIRSVPSTIYKIDKNGKGVIIRK